MVVSCDKSPAMSSVIARDQYRAERGSKLRAIWMYKIYI